MGMCASCCKPSSSGVITPDMETRRRQQVEAAERRAAAEAGRGVKNPDILKRMQQKTEQMEKREQELSRQGGPALKWTAD